MSTRIQHRRDTAANWTSNNPVLAQGEPALETDTGFRKIGDGSTTWNALSYEKVPPSALPNTTEVTSNKDQINGYAGLDAGGKLKVPELPSAVVVKRTTTGSHAHEYPRFRIDDYGSDPTGVALSDAAWTACYADAVASIQGTGGGSAGAMVELGSGIYKFSINTVKVLDYRIGLCAQGKSATQITSTGNNGDIVYITDTTVSTFMSAPCYGFTVYGFNAGVNVNGFHYGDRAAAILSDIEVLGCQAVGSRNYLFKNDNGSTAGCEGTIAFLSSQQGGVSNVTFDGNNNSPSGSQTFDYAQWNFHGVGQAVGQNHSWVEIINKAQLSGGRLSIMGNISANNTFTATLLKVGNSGSDVAQLLYAELAIAVEADAGTGGTCKDIVIQADASFGGGIFHCHGSFNAINSTASFTAGSSTGNTLFSLAGHLNAPVFTSIGNLATIGMLSAFDLYANNMKLLTSSTTGAIQSGNTTGPGTTREWTGSGVPTTPGGAITYVVNDRYWRSDGGAGTRLYICTVGGGSPTWAAVAGI